MALELLSPAGSPEALRAAVQSGCGAVYLGWGNFNARRSAKNFSDEEFADAIRYCHLRGIRVFLTLNTLLTDRELPLALDAARTACRLGVDSVLVQDWGLFALLREALPDLPLHASTQMSVFTAGGANEVYVDGCGNVEPLYLKDLQDPATGKILPRMVDISSDRFKAVVDNILMAITPPDYEAARQYLSNPEEYDFCKILGWDETDL